MYDREKNKTSKHKTQEKDRKRQEQEQERNKRRTENKQRQKEMFKKTDKSYQKSLEQVKQRGEDGHLCSEMLHEHQRNCKRWAGSGGLPLHMDSYYSKRPHTHLMMV
ncbi:hypothetical protein M0813_19536 [Anaeramoeba flamelloides]|uniref:Uncharacterized protein n=1 Tax=Anaeramoeba flamelloides TaxID=1746091 RepID=A0ABQ8YP54_9EUKA|nr:hypothetical protein M0813_19536 [Anaeramoeba flamelloides]